MDYRDLIRQNKKRFADSSELVSVLFNQIYDRVEPKYFPLAVFGIKLGKEKNIGISNRSVFKQENIETELMFYYCLDKRRDLHFTLIDLKLNFVYFKTDDILKLRQDFIEEFDLFE